MLIDFHTHCFPDHLAPRAMERLTAIAGIPVCTDGTSGDLLAKMDLWGVDTAVCLHIATTPKQQTNVNNFAISLNDRKRIFSFGSVHGENPEAVQELYRLSESGIIGVKLHPDYQNMDLLDHRMFPIYDTLSQLGMPCVFHSGWDPVSPEHTRVTPDRVLRLHQLFPHLIMILAHMGGLFRWDEVEEKLAGTGIFMDTSFTAGNLDPAQCARIIQKNGAENILFGSDCPWQESRTTADYIDSLPLPAADKDRIFFQNAQRLLGITV